MSIKISSRNSDYSFNTSFGGFYSLRCNIAKAWDLELGKAYSNISLLKDNPKKYFSEIKTILLDDRFNEEDEDLLDFLFENDSRGKCSYIVCKKIYQLIKDIDYRDSYFTMKSSINDFKRNDYEDFKLFLKECWKKHRNMNWEVI